MKCDKSPENYKKLQFLNYPNHRGNTTVLTITGIATLQITMFNKGTAAVGTLLCLLHFGRKDSSHC